MTPQHLGRHSDFGPQNGLFVQTQEIGDALRDPQISYFVHIVVYQDILCFEISVDDLVLVEFLNERLFTANPLMR